MGLSVKVAGWSGRWGLIEGGTSEGFYVKNDLNPVRPGLFGAPQAWGGCFHPPA